MIISKIFFPYQIKPCIWWTQHNFIHAFFLQFFQEYYYFKLKEKERAGGKHIAASLAKITCIWKIILTVWQCISKIKFLTKIATLPQFNSSLLSPQSLSPSQTHRLVIHLLLLHVNSSSEHVNWSEMFENKYDIWWWNLLSALKIFNVLLN